MLKTFRGLLAGPGKYVFAVLLILAFSVVGVPALENFGSSSAVKVGSQEISALELQREIDNQIRSIQMQNPNVTRSQAIEAGVPQQAIQMLVARALIDEEAERLGLATPNDVLQDYIRQIDGLTDPETGEFDQQVLGAFLAQQGIALGTFRDMVAADMIRQQLTEALETGAPAPQDLTRYLILLQFMERDMRVAEIPADAAATEPTEEEIEAAYQENLMDYMSPEYRTLTVLTISSEDVADEIEIDEADVRQLYEVQVGAAAATETRDVRQILVPADRAEEAAALIENGADLDALAEEFGVRINRLNDQFQSDFINEDVGEAVFAAEQGMLVGPVETDFGTVFAEVTEVTGTEGDSFEDRREELEAELLAEIARERVSELVEAVESARDTGATLGEAASSVGLEARTVGPVDSNLFTRFDSIANISPFLGTEGFRLEEGEESAPLRLEDGYGFVSVDAVEAPQPRPLDDVRETVVARLAAEARENAAEEIEARFQAALAGGEDFAQAAAALGGEVSTYSFGPNNEPTDIPQEALSTLADLNIGDIASVPANNQPSVYVVELTDVSFVDSSAAMASLPIIASQLGQQASGELNNAYLESLEERAEVTQNPRQISRALGLENQ